MKKTNSKKPKQQKKQVKKPVVNKSYKKQAR